MAVCWDRRVLLSFKKWKSWIQTTGLSDASKLDFLSNHRTLNNHNKTITKITTLIFWQFVETAGYFCHSKNESAEFKLPASVTIRSWIFYLIIELWIIVTRQLLKLQLWYFGNLLRPQGTSVIPKMKALNSKYRTQWRASKLDLLSNHRTLNNRNKTITKITTLDLLSKGNWLPASDRRVLLSFQKWERWIQNTGLSDARQSWIFYLIIELWIIITRQLLKLQLWSFGNLLRPQGTSVIQKMKELNSNYRPQWRFEVGFFI